MNEEAAHVQRNTLSTFTNAWTFPGYIIQLPNLLMCIGCMIYVCVSMVNLDLPSTFRLAEVLEVATW